MSSEYWVCPACHSLNRARAGTCYACHAQRPPADPAPFRPDATGSGAATAAAGSDGAATIPQVTASTATEPGSRSFGPPAGPAFATASAGAAGSLAPGGFVGGVGIVTSTPPPAPAAHPDATAVASGIVGGLAGAVLATLLWYGFVSLTDVQFGLVAVAVGAIVGYGVVLGTGGRMSFPLVVVSALLTVGALLASEYLIVLRVANEVAAQYAGQYGVSVAGAVPTDPPTLIRIGLTSDPLTLLFWAIAVFESFIIPWRRLVGRR